MSVSVNPVMESEETSAGSQKEGSRDYTQYGITDVPKYTTTTALGQTKTFAGLYPKEWAFLIVSTANILAAIGITIFRLVKVIEDDSGSSDFTFTILLLINAGFCAFYVIHGVLRERVYELYALIAAIIVVTMYCLLEYAAFNIDGQTTAKLVRLILACVLAPPNIVLAVLVARDFGYLAFRIVGASEFLQNLYKQAAIFSCFLKLDLQASASFVILALREGTSVTTQEIISLSVGLPYTCLWSLLGWIVLRRELKTMAWVFVLLGLVKPAYYFYKIIQVYIAINDDPSQVTYSDTIVYSLFAAGAIALLSWLIIMVELVVVYKNFGQGLRERAFETLASEHTSLLTGRRSRWK